jgi:hypothetical protein
MLFWKTRPAASYSPNIAVFNARTFLAAVSAGLESTAPEIARISAGRSAAAPDGVPTTRGWTPIAMTIASVSG